MHLKVRSKVQQDSLCVPLVTAKFSPLALQAPGPVCLSYPAPDLSAHHAYNSAYQRLYIHLYTLVLPGVVGVLLFHIETSCTVLPGIDPVVCELRANCCHWNCFSAEMV